MCIMYKLPASICVYADRLHYLQLQWTNIHIFSQIVKIVEVLTLVV